MCLFGTVAHLSSDNHHLLLFHPPLLLSFNDRYSFPAPFSILTESSMNVVFQLVALINVPRMNYFSSAADGRKEPLFSYSTHKTHIQRDREALVALHFLAVRPMMITINYKKTASILRPRRPAVSQTHGARSCLIKKESTGLPFHLILWSLWQLINGRN